MCALTRADARTGEGVTTLRNWSLSVGRLSTWLAEAYLGAGEIDAATAITGQILTLAADIASVRPAERLHDILRRLSRYSDAQRVADVLARARALLPV